MNKTIVERVAEIEEILEADAWTDALAACHARLDKLEGRPGPPEEKEKIPDTSPGEALRFVHQSARRFLEPQELEFGPVPPGVLAEPWTAANPGETQVWVALGEAGHGWLGWTVVAMLHREPYDETLDEAVRLAAAIERECPWAAQATLVGRGAWIEIRVSGYWRN